MGQVFLISSPVYAHPFPGTIRLIRLFLTLVLLGIFWTLPELGNWQFCQLEESQVVTALDGWPLGSGSVDLCTKSLQLVLECNHHETISFNLFDVSLQIISRWIVCQKFQFHNSPNKCSHLQVFHRLMMKADVGIRAVLSQRSTSHKKLHLVTTHNLIVRKPEPCFFLFTEGLGGV